MTWTSRYKPGQKVVAYPDSAFSRIVEIGCVHRNSVFLKAGLFNDSCGLPCLEHKTSWCLDDPILLLPLKHTYPLTKKAMQKYVSVAKMEKKLGKDKVAKILKTLQSREDRNTLFAAPPLSSQELTTLRKCLKVKNWAAMKKYLKCAHGSEFHNFAKLAFRQLKHTAPFALI